MLSLSQVLMHARTPVLYAALFLLIAGGLHVLLPPTAIHIHTVICAQVISWSCVVHMVMQEPGSDPASMAASRAAQTAGQGGGGWMDTILNLIPGRKQKATDEPSEDAIKRTHDYLRLDVVQNGNYMDHNDAFSAKQPDCCLSCITLAATVADSVIQHSSCEPRPFERGASGMLTAMAAIGRRQRVQLSLRLLRERRYGQCWMCPGHPC